MWQFHLHLLPSSTDSQLVTKHLSKTSKDDAAASTHVSIKSSVTSASSFNSHRPTPLSALHRLQERVNDDAFVPSLVPSNSRNYIATTSSQQLKQSFPTTNSSVMAAQMEQTIINGLYGPGSQQIVVTGPRNALTKLKQAIDEQGHVVSQKSHTTQFALPKMCYAHLQESGDYPSDFSLNKLLNGDYEALVGVTRKQHFDELPPDHELDLDPPPFDQINIITQLGFLRGVALYFYNVMADCEDASDERVYELGILTMNAGYGFHTPTYTARVYQTRKDAEVTHTIWLYRPCSWVPYPFNHTDGVYKEWFHGIGAPENDGLSSSAGSEGNDNDGGDEKGLDFSQPPPTVPRTLRKRKPKQTKAASDYDDDDDMLPTGPRLKRRASDPAPDDEEERESENDPTPPPKSRMRKRSRKTSTSDAGDEKSPEKGGAKKKRNIPKRRRSAAPADLINQTPDEILNADPDFVLGDVLLRVTPHYSNSQIHARLNATLARDGRELIKSANNVVRRISVAQKIEAGKSGRTFDELKKELRRSRVRNGVVTPNVNDDRVSSTDEDAPAVTDEETCEGGGRG